MTTSAEVRDRLTDALRLDLVGPRPGEPAHARYAEEVLPIAPSNWYLTGFLVPYEAPTEQRSDPDGDDELDQASRVGSGDDENTPEQRGDRGGPHGRREAEPAPRRGRRRDPARVGNPRTRHPGS